MAIIPVKIDGHKIQAEDEVEELTFKELSLKEADLEEFFRQSIGRLFGDEESLLIVGQQVVDEARSRSDLVALDGQGCLVLIEIKRDLEDIKSRAEALESQAIRYAAALAMIRDPRDLVDKMFAAYIDKHKNEEPYRAKLAALSLHELANREVTAFLKQNKVTSGFNQRQRIILVASEFDAITLSSAAWLIKSGIDMACYELKPLRIRDEIVLNFERILPVDRAEEFFINISTTLVEEDETDDAIIKQKRRTFPRMPMLMEWGIVKAGDRLAIKNFPNSEATIIDSKFVEFRDKKFRFNEWGQEVTGWSSICIYDWAIVEATGQTLKELRTKKLKEMEKAKSNAA